MREPITHKQAAKLTASVNNMSVYLTQEEYDAIMEIIKTALDELCKELGVFKSAT